jgi:hypothetical protein
VACFARAGHGGYGRKQRIPLYGLLKPGALNGDTGGPNGGGDLPDAYAVERQALRRLSFRPAPSRVLDHLPTQTLFHRIIWKGSVNRIGGHPCPFIRDTGVPYEGTPVALMEGLESPAPVGNVSV